VIRLRYVVKVPYHRRTALSRRAMFARDEHRCQYCGGVRRLDRPRDAALARWRAPRLGQRRGRVPAVQPVSKRDRTPDEAGMRLARPAHAPRELAWVSVAVQPRARRVEAVPGAGQLNPGSDRT
jgi:hypothetical protein